MSDLMVKSVDVLGDAVMAAQDRNGIIWVGIRWMCQGMGMSDGQYKRQITNIQKDLLLKSSGSNLVLNKGSGEREVFCLKLDYLPIWLAKITLTEKTRKENPELADKLLEYQLKAKDILAEAFMPKKGVPQTIPEQIQLLAQGNVEVNKRVDAVEKEIQKLKDDMPVFQADARDIQSDLRKKAVEALGGYKSPAYNDKSTRTYVFADIQRELRRQFDVKRYDQIKHKDTPIALEIIAQYKLPLALKNRVDMMNAQQSLGLKGGGVA